MATRGKRKRVVVSMKLRLDADDDGDDIFENTTSLISDTDGMKALEAASCYAEQQSSASAIDVMLIKKTGNYTTSCRISRLLQKKLTHFFNASEPVPGGLKLPFNSGEDRSEAVPGGLKLSLNSDEDRSETVPGAYRHSVLEQSTIVTLEGSDWTSESDFACLFTSDHALTESFN
ncbi:hypothetical protein AVEN_154155-1 [Araneus ventricosus]|uniref:Uncharacterized protein n=1 Tax=Araneus ventricosus TaxID=182803 RepID=A0A4Y2SI29_ARAVE|nr:hypothetical protein AVEN_154155-1 [Araneus ventricosus]